MKIYIDKQDVGTTITYKEECGRRQFLYVHDKEGFVFKELEDKNREFAIETLKNLWTFVDILSKMNKKDTSARIILNKIDEEIEKMTRKTEKFREFCEKMRNN